MLLRQSQSAWKQTASTSGLTAIMTKIYCYCLFDGQGRFQGVYSSVAAVHRDAMKTCNKGFSPVFVKYGDDSTQPTSLTLLRNLFKGEVDIKVTYVSDASKAVILKTKLRE